MRRLRLLARPWLNHAIQDGGDPTGTAGNIGGVALDPANHPDQLAENIGGAPTHGWPFLVDGGGDPDRGGYRTPLPGPFS